MHLFIFYIYVLLNFSPFLNIYFNLSFIYLF